MKVTTPEISWHERDPIYSVDIQPGKRSIKRLVSGGVDKFVRIWQIIEDSDGKGSVEFLANLKRHSKAVNVCRFSNDGEILATAGDDAVIIFWKLSDTSSSGNIFQDDEEDNKENWSLLKVLRGHLEDVYDLCWSADDKFMISGSVDNSAILWDLTKDQKIALLNEHQSFVQGVTWDPQNEFVATISTDRSCRVFNIANRNCVHTIKKMSLPAKSDSGDQKESKPKSFRMFHDDTMRSFFRRLTFSPDGELLIVPSGLVEADPVTNATFVFTRRCLNKPALYLPSPDKVTIAVRCCPTKFQLRGTPKHNAENNETEMKEWEKYSTLFCLPYRYVFAVATEDAIQLYDTQQPEPFGFITNVHYHQLSDIAWSSDGSTMVVSSTDGYCTLVTFSDTELGVPYRDAVEADGKEADTVVMETSDSQGIVAMETDPSDSFATKKSTKEHDQNKNSSEGHQSLSTKSGNTDCKKSDTQNAENKSQTSKPMAMKVKSADGKPKNIQITTLTSGSPATSASVAKPVAIQVKSVDGKPKNVNITTLSSYGNLNNSVNNDENRGSKSNGGAVEVKERPEKKSTDAVILIDDDSCETSGNASGSSQSVKTSSESDTKPKRVQLTTLQLFKNS